MKLTISTKSLDSYRRLLKYIRPYAIPFVFGMLAAVPSGSMEAIMAYLAGQGLQKIIVEGRQHLLIWVPVAVLVIALLQGLFRFLESYLIRLVGASAIRDLRNDVFCHLTRQPLQYFHGNSSGVLIARVVNDIAIIENAISQTFQTMISRLVTLISLAFVLIYQSFWLSVIALSIFSLILIPVSILGKKIRAASRLGQVAIGDLVGVLGESIQGVKVVQSFNLEKYQIERFKATNQDFLNNTMKAVRSEAMMSPVLAQIGAVGIAAVIWVAGYQVINGYMTIGALTSFTIALMLLYSPLKTIGRINGIIQPALAAADRVFEILDQEPELTDSTNTQELKPGPHNIEFAKVTFKYPGHEELVLQSIDLIIPAGKMVALVGNSGAGKSTIANLVPRFFDPSEGTILIDGKPLHNYDLNSLRSQIAVVTQDNFLFNTTVGENILLGKPGAPVKEVEEAAKAAYCHDFITE
ncbi:MAG: ABC transporter ATP-binding protein/permease, partial [Candidatus Obscuribacterales bacterium]|nr:ABC transporter ATP-binding protein/permease [Candidatus Obscuribacterales bacterium]